MTDDARLAPTAPPGASPDASDCPRCATRSVVGGLCRACDYGAPDALVGAVLAGKYRVDARLAEGGIGAVYLGTRLDLGEPVALKFLLPRWAGDADLRARFRREALALARVRHPGMVAVYDVGEHAGAPFLAMEFVEGTTLHELGCCGAEGLPLARVVRIVDQVLAVLDVAHRAGIVHRDIKPGNVMVLDSSSDDDLVKLIDFGLALMRDDDASDGRLTATNVTMGTWMYMSPEQCRGRDVGPPTDIYAVGAMLFQLLAGAPPFEGRAMADFVPQHLFVDPPRIAERGRRRAVPAGFEALVRRALAKSAELRPTAQQMRRELADALAGRDAESVAGQASARRSGEAGVSREERGLHRSSPLATVPLAILPLDPAADGASQQVSPSGEARPLVALWGFAPARADDLRQALGVRGLATETWEGDVPRAEGPRPAVVLLAASGAVAARVERLRADGRFAIAHLVVSELPDASAMPGLVRAGVSDVVLARAGDDALGARVLQWAMRTR